MPTLRGLTVGIYAHFDQAQHPEYKDIHSRNTTTTISGASYVASTDTAINDDDGTSSSVSVYIPSVSAERFFVKYTVLPPYTAGVYFYFKMFMNGRHVNSWGINPRTKFRGRVTKTLFQGEELDHDENGEPFVKVGTEARSLMFAMQKRKQNAANNGGTIEVLAFRSRGKRRKHAEPQVFRSQEEYDLLFPSSGFISSLSEDSKFYDWILIDPKDYPYATFRFHYRTWDSLQSLQIVPRDNPRDLLPVSQSFGSLAEYLSKAYGNDMLNQGSHDDNDNDNDIGFPEIPIPIAKGLGAIDSTRHKLMGILKHSNYYALNEDFATSDTNSGENQARHSDSSIESGRSLGRNLVASAGDYLIEDDLKNRSSYARPLPLPPSKTSEDRGIKLQTPQLLSTHSRGSSIASTESMDSITPSLRNWVRSDVDIRNPSPITEVGTATLVYMPSPESNPIYDEEIFASSSKDNSLDHVASLLFEGQFQGSRTEQSPLVTFTSPGSVMQTFNARDDTQSDSPPPYLQHAHTGLEKPPTSSINSLLNAAALHGSPPALVTPRRDRQDSRSNDPLTPPGIVSTPSRSSRSLTRNSNFVIYEDKDNTLLPISSNTRAHDRVYQHNYRLDQENLPNLITGYQSILPTILGGNFDESFDGDLAGSF